jgi:hypothetical protein
MSLYPESVARCQHIKVNGTQCASPALRAEKYCYFHMRWHTTRMSVLLKEREHWIAGLPTLEDANSIQVGLAEVMRLLVTKEIDSKTGALLLYAMQTASANMKHTSFEPEPTQVVIDRECVERRPIGATAWSTVEGREYDEVENDDVEKHGVEKDESEKEGRRFEADLMRLIAGRALDPDFLDRRRGDLPGKQEKESGKN